MWVTVALNYSFMCRFEWQQHSISDFIWKFDKTATFNVIITVKIWFTSTLDNTFDIHYYNFKCLLAWVITPNITISFEDLHLIEFEKKTFLTSSAIQLHT